MKRLIENKLDLWFQTEKKKPLLIKGARQVGKTYSIRVFGEQYYDNIIEINFEKQIEYINLFQSTHNPKDILSFLQLSYPGIILDKNTLLFLDEIQACSDALTSLKFLAEEFPCDIICSGSALGVAIANSTSFPVGYVETWEMFPLTFQEFLWAYKIGDSLLQMMIHSLSAKTPLLASFHTKLAMLFKEYVVVGGMPEVVSTFMSTHSFKEVNLVQKRLVGDYMNDMAKYAQGSDRVKTRECFESIPLQLAKENKKFQYKVVRKGYDARHYESSLQWLQDSNLVLKVNRLHQILSPLDAHRELSIFKIYLNDTGLLVSMFEESIAKDILFDTANMYKGAIYENVAAQIFAANQKKCYYFEPNHTNEIDFITILNGSITPFEIKSGTHTKSISFKRFVEKYKPQYAYCISMKNIGKQDQIISIPFYLLDLLLQEENH